MKILASWKDKHSQIALGSFQKKREHVSILFSWLVNETINVMACSLRILENVFLLFFSSLLR